MTTEEWLSRINDAVVRLDPVAPATRRCGKCDQVKPLWEFHVRRADPSGRQARCRTCVAEYNEQRRQQRDEVEALARQWLELCS